MYVTCCIKTGSKYRQEGIINSYLMRQINSLINKIGIKIYIQLSRMIPFMFKCTSAFPFSLPIVLAC